MNRRLFIKSAIATSVFTLGGVSAFQYYQQSSLNYPEKINTTFLTQDDQLVLNIFIPVMSGKLDRPANLETSIMNIDNAIKNLPLRTQKELRELFNLLSSGIGRLILAGVWLNWQKTDKEQVLQFLANWRESQLSLLQQAYVGLHQLIIGSIYAESTHWNEIDYPGPLRLF